MESMVVYRDLRNNCWWEERETHRVTCHPFGHFVLNYINTCASLTQGRDIFIESEYFYQSHSMDSSTSYALAAHLGWCDESGALSKEKMGEYYDKFVSTDKRIKEYKDEYSLLINYIKNIDGFRNGNNSTKSLLGIYDYFKYFSTCSGSDIYSYQPAGKERNEYFNSIFNKLIAYKGPTFIEGCDTPIEGFKLEEFCNLFILDFWEFLFNPIFRKSKTHVCPNCNSIFISTNNQATYCEVCKQPEIMGKIRYENRKKNKARKLHQDILTMTYKFNKNKENEYSNAFLNESNYYWDVIRGKRPEKIKGYSTKIQTKEDYIEWLEMKRKELKGRK